MIERRRLSSICRTSSQETGFEIVSDSPQMLLSCHRRFVVSVLMFGLPVLMCGLPGCGESIPEVEGVEVELDSANFAEEVLQDDGLVLVDFWAPWCGPCRQMEPAVAYLSVQYEGRLKVGKVTVDDNPDLATEYGIEGIPAFVMFREGEVIGHKSGPASYRTLSRWVDQQLAE